MEGADQIDWSGATIDSTPVRARGGAEQAGPSPVARRKKGTKQTVLTEAPGIPLAITHDRANCPDVKTWEPTLEVVPPVRRLGIPPKIARRRTQHGSGLGRVRWVNERTISWLPDFGRLRVRKDRDSLIHQGFLTLGVCRICFNHLA